jgi:hypothetical protein
MVEQQPSLIGTWRGSTAQTGMLTQIETTLSQDGSFRTTVQSASGVLHTWGTYSIQGTAITYSNKDFAPKVQNVPGPFGQIVSFPVTVPPQDTSFFRWQDANTLIIQSSVPGIQPVAFQRIVGNQ